MTAIKKMFFYIDKFRSIPWTSRLQSFSSASKEKYSNTDEEFQPIAATHG